MCPNSEKKLSFKKSFLVLTIVVLGFNRGESYAFESQKGHNHNKMNHSKMKKESRKSLSESTKKTILKVLEANEALHYAFFKYDGKAIENHAIKLKKTIEAIKDNEIAKLLNYSKKILSSISTLNDRETNNRNYHLVSMALIHIIKNYDVGSNYNGYSCPMVKKKWIQNNSKMKKVYNPYALNMPHCGSQDTHF